MSVDIVVDSRPGYDTTTNVAMTSPLLLQLRRWRRRSDSDQLLNNNSSSNNANITYSPAITEAGSVAEWLACWTQAQKAGVQIAVATLSGNSGSRNRSPLANKVENIDRW